VIELIIKRLNPQYAGLPEYLGRICKILSTEFAPTMNRMVTAVVLILPQIYFAGGFANDHVCTNATTTTTALIAIDAIPTPIRTDQIIPKRAAIASRRSTNHIRIDVTAAAPDLLGISRVSGWYGPGTWAAWFFTIVGSWCGLLRGSKAKIDPNTGAFLVGMNWAAMDLLRYIVQVKHVHTDAERRLHMGSYAAAFNVTFWGMIHAVTQCFILFNSLKTSQRVGLLTRLAGIVLPLVALSIAGVQLTSNGLLNAFPTLYTHYTHGIGERGHQLLLILSASSSIWVIELLLWEVMFIEDDLFSRMARFAGAKGTIVAVLLCFVSFASALFGLLTSNIICLAMGLPSFLFVAYWTSAIMAPSLIFMWTGTTLSFSITHVLEAYVIDRSKISKSCYFMPCAPQKITDEDQLYPLLAGMASLLGFDVRPLVWKNYKKWKEARREMNEWVQNIGERLRRPIGGGPASHATSSEGMQLRELRRIPTAGMVV
jgi:hypothetical protein